MWCLTSLDIYFGSPVICGPLLGAVIKLLCLLGHATSSTNQQHEYFPSVSISSWGLIELLEVLLPPHPHISRLKSYWILPGNFIKENSLRLEIWLLLRTDTTGDICKLSNRQSLAHWLSLLSSNIIFKNKILIILSLDRWQHVSEHLLSLQSCRAYAFNFRSHSLLKITDTFMLKYST